MFHWQMMFIHLRIPEQNVSSKLYWYTKRAWDPTCYSSHVLRLWHRSNSKNEQRRSPRRMYIYDNNSSLPMMADNFVETDITYPWAPLLLCCLTIRLELPDSCVSRTKRQITLFLYIGSHPRQHRTQARLRYENTAKIEIIFETTKKKEEKVWI